MSRVIEQIILTKIGHKHILVTVMNLHRIHRVAKLTGLSKDVIRVWERRFGILKPTRGTNRYRNYSDDDVALLRYLKEQLDAGASIGDLAQLGREELLTRLRTILPRAAFVDNTFARLLRELISALNPLDRVTFEKRLNGAVAVVPFEEALHGILLPLQEQVGQRWHSGLTDIATEHYVTNQIRQKLYAAMNQLPVAEFGAKIIVACPPGEEHDIGALAVAYRCRVRGCRVYYLGANLPIASLGKLCREAEPDLTILSIPSSLAEHTLTELIEALIREVSPSSTVLVGGNGALASRDQLERSHIHVLASFNALDDALDQATRRLAIPK